MCVIIICPKDTEIERSIITTAIERNPHGWGMSQKQPDGSFRVSKGWSEAEAWRKWRRLGSGLERVFHARVATHGGVSLANLHPFDASYGDTKRLFYHNGTINGLPLLDPKYSDSWHFSLYLRNFPTSKALIDDIATFARKESSRFAFCTENETWMFGSGWIKRDGVHYSNGSALGGVEHRRRAWAGGLLHAEGTESDSHIDGFKFDAATKTYRPDPTYKPPTQPLVPVATRETEYEGGVITYKSGRSTYLGTKIDPDACDVYPLALTDEQRKEGLAYRWADKKGVWTENVKVEPSVPGGRATYTNKVVEGPHPGTVVYGPCGKLGWGSVYCAKSNRILGQYQYDRLSEYIKTTFAVAPPPTEEEKPPIAEQDDAEFFREMERQGEQAYRSQHSYTTAEWEALMDSELHPVFVNWTDSEILYHYSKNNGSLFPLPTAKVGRGH